MDRNSEFQFSGLVLNGFLMLFVNIAVLALSVAGAVCSFRPLAMVAAGFVIWILILPGFVMLEPNQAYAMVFFGKYRGTFRRTGFSWVNPFISARKVSQRATNMNPEPIKVNDRRGNPIMIGSVLVWRVSDIYKALFEIDTQTGEARQNTQNGRMRAFQNFVSVQSDAALRQVAGMFPYDSMDDAGAEVTLRSGADEINDLLRDKLNERLQMSGIEVLEARINYLAYAPEIAAVMLRRQQADAIISARERIVDGAVSMVGMALEKLSKDGIVEMDEDRKAAMVSNLMVVLCSDEAAQPVVNAGSGAR